MSVDMRSDKMHLEPERMAAFDQEPFTTDELAHMARCGDCRRELRAMATVRELARGSVSADAADKARLIEWDALAVALRDEGMLSDASRRGADPLRDVSGAAMRISGGTSAVHAEASSVASRDRLYPRSGTWWRMAAAAVLMTGGATVGRVTATRPFGRTVDRGESSAVAVAASVGATGAFGSVQQASDILYRAQRDYERASLWLAANDTTMHSSDVYRARLEALDQMMAASRAALQEAPQDPVLNHYFLSAYNAREATLQALGGALPVDKTLERY